MKCRIPKTSQAPQPPTTPQISLFDKTVRLIGDSNCNILVDDEFEEDLAKSSGVATILRKVNGKLVLFYQGRAFDGDDVLCNAGKPVGAVDEQKEFYYFSEGHGVGLARDRSKDAFYKKHGWLWQYGGFDFFICRSGNGLGYYAYEGRSGYLIYTSFNLQYLKACVSAIVDSNDFAVDIERDIKETGLSPLYKEIKE